MATSSKVRFDLATLTKEALSTLDTKIEVARLQVDSHLDDEALATQVAQWRERQAEKVRRLAEEIESGEVDDYRLAKFKIDAIPERDRRSYRDDVRELERLQARRLDVEAKAKSLVPDEDGSVSLTKTQLRDFFNL